MPRKGLFKMDNYEVKKEFKFSEVLELASTWYDCGTGFAAIVGKEVTRQFGRGSRFAGRECIMISKDGKKLTLGDWQGLDRFQTLSREKVASFFDQGQEEKPAEKAAKKPVKKTSQASEKKPAQKAASEKQPQPTGLQFGPALVADKNGKATIASLLHAGKVFASRTVPAEFSDRFKKYSEDNRLLLYVQGGPALGQVATYRGWIKQGRQVSKGQHGLKILAPRMVPDENGNPKIDGLRLVTLFSVDQTEEASQEA